MSKIYAVDFNHNITLCKKCPYLESFCPYSVRMHKNTEQNNSEYGHFHAVELTSKKLNEKMKPFKDFRTGTQELDFSQKF